MRPTGTSGDMRGSIGIAFEALKSAWSPGGSRTARYGLYQGTSRCIHEGPERLTLATAVLACIRRGAGMLVVPVVRELAGILARMIPLSPADTSSAGRPA